MKPLIKLRLSLACGLLLVSVACSGLVSMRGSTTTGPESAGKDPRGELTKAMKAMLAAGSYRARTEFSSSNGSSGTNTIEFVAPDRFHITREINRPGRASSTQETIVIANDTWMKMGNSGWQKFPMNLGELIAQFRDPKVVEEIAKATDVKFAGGETFDGKPMMVYEYTLSDTEGNGFKITSRTWIDVNDNLPRKTESEGEMNFAGKQITTRTIVAYYDYGADIKIERPV